MKSSRLLSYTVAAIVTLSTVTAVTPVFAQPQVQFPQPELDFPIKGPTGIVSIISRAAGWFWQIMLALGVIFILVAAFQFMTAGGDSEKVATARKSLLWGLVGLAIALFAFAAVSWVGSFVKGLGGGGSSNTQLQPNYSATPGT